MNIGIGLPATIAGVSGARVLEWARRAEERGFTSLCAIDRVNYPNYDPLVALAAAGAVTSRPQLVTAILLAPLRSNHLQFARQISSIEQVSDGRLLLGLGVGSRREDYDLSGVDFHRRGRLFDELLETSLAVWRGERGPIGPTPVHADGPPLYFGGESAAALRRTARFGTGWIAGAGTAQEFEQNLANVTAAFREAGRTDHPKSMKLGYFALGADAPVQVAAMIGSYYGFRGAERVQQIIDVACTSEEAVARTCESFAGVGCDDLIFLPTNPDLTQVDLLADSLGLA